jgi:hypothetical protein
LRGVIDWHSCLTLQSLFVFFPSFPQSLLTIWGKGEKRERDKSRKRRGQNKEEEKKTEIRTRAREEQKI